MSQEQLLIVKGLIIGAALVSYKAVVFITACKKLKEDKEDKDKGDK